MNWITNLVDAFKSVKKPPATEQTDNAQLSYLPKEFSDHPGKNITPARAASLLQEAEQGNLKALAELADDMEERDAHLFAELSKRRRACISAEWKLELRNPDAAEQKALDELHEKLADFPWGDVIFDMTDAIHKGYANLELSWEQIDGYWLPSKVEHRPASWFEVKDDARDDLLIRSQSGKGEPLQPWSWISLKHKARSGYLTNAALARILVWPFLFRNYSSRDLAEFLEIYGLPVRLGRYPTGATDNEKATLLRAVTAIGHNAAGIIPQGMQVEFQQAAQGQSDPFIAMIEWAERSMSKAILGGTLTSESGKNGNYATANVHDDVRKEIRSSDLRLISATLTRDLITPIVLFNTKLKRVPKLVLDDTEPEDLGLYADALPKLAGSMPIPAAWAYKKLKIPMPVNDEPILKAITPKLTDLPPASTAANSAKAGCGCGCNTPIAALKTLDNADLNDAIIDTIPDAKTLQQQSEAMIKPLVELAAQCIDEGLDTEATMAKLAAKFTEMDSSVLESALSQSLFIANLAGRLEAQNEAV